MWRPPPPGSPLRRPEGRLGAPRTLPAGHAETYPGSMHALAGPRGPRAGRLPHTKRAGLAGGLPLQPLTSRARPPHPSLRGAPFPACRLPSPSSHLHTSQTQTRSLLPTNWETDLLPPPDGSTQAIIPMPPSRAAPSADRSVLGTSDQDPQGSSAHLARQAAAGGF